MQMTGNTILITGGGSLMGPDGETIGANAALED